MNEAHVHTILTAYPQVYHACHFRHIRARTSANHVSSRDAWILGHLDPKRGLSPAKLAKHMGLSASTVSEAVKRLERLGYVTRRSVAGDARRIDLLLAPHGVTAMRASSVLDADRVKALLGLLPPTKRAKAVAGMSLLAEAARSLNAKSPKKWPDHADA